MNATFPRWLAVVLAAVGPASAITPNAQEIELAGLIASHRDQRRPSMVYDARLNLSARKKALDMAQRRYFDHADPEGYAANKAAQLTGYKLPAWWGTALDANYIESIAAGYSSPQAAFNGWLGSGGHRDHLLGEDPFYAGQTRYGVGCVDVPGSEYGKYYVFVSAPPSLDGDRPLEPYIEWLFTHFRLQEIDTTGDTSDTNTNGIPRLVEFLLNFNPAANTALPSPVFTAGRLEWTLPIRADRGSVTFEVQHSATLASGSWTTQGVQNLGGNRYAAPPGTRGYLRIWARRP